MDLERERDLLAHAQQSSAGFGELFDVYYDRIYSYAYRRVGARAVAEDIASCTFEDALRGIRKVKWEDKPIAAWLYRIASRRIVDYFRRNRDHGQVDAESTGAVELTLDDVIVKSDREAFVSKALEQLKPKEREVIQLTYFDEMDGAEIAALLGCTANNVYVRLHRALKHLADVVNAGEQGAKHGME